MKMNSVHALSAENFLATLPAVLREDQNTRALAAAIASALERRVEEVRRVSIYSQIDTLPEELLDILAYDFKVDWYDYDYSLEQKRRTLKDSFLVHRHLGTKFAVQTAISAIYPNTKVEEWFEYGGVPHAFRLHITVDERTFGLSKHSRVLELVQYYKNLRSYLDKIIYTLETSEPATVHIGGSMTSVVTLAIPVIVSQYQISQTAHIGSVLASVATVEIPAASDRAKFKHGLHTGGHVSTVVLTPIPAQ